MPLPVPDLDTRDFRSLMEEARARIPAFTPEWTNFNESDPGVALVELQAWLTEVLLFQLNRLPDMAYVRFLNMIGTTPEPARAARAELKFRFAELKRAGDPLTILVPKGAQVGVKDPALSQPIVFETDETLRGLNATIAALIVPGTGTDWALAGSYDADAAELSLLRPFRPFGAAGAGEMFVGLLLRPVRDDSQSYFLDRFPAGELALTCLVPEVLETGADDAPISGPAAAASPFSWEVAADAAGVEWSVLMAASAPDLEANGAAAWRSLPLRLDETGGFRRSGRIYLDMPEDVPMHAMTALPRAFWLKLGLMRPPQTTAELVADLQAEVFLPADLDLDIWKGPIGLPAPPLQDRTALIAQLQALPAAAQPDFAAIDPEAWAELGYSPSPAPHGLVWLRARQAVLPDRAPQVAGLHLNAVRATAAVTRLSEVLGSSAARPNQSFGLGRAPVLIDPATGLPDLELALVPPDGSATEPWVLVPDFAGSGRNDPHYLLDPGTGVVTLGDGVHGRIPVAGSRIVALRYRVGGGAIGNVAAGTVSQLKTALPQVASVSNLRAAKGGSDAQSLEEAKLAAPAFLRSRDRAVTAEDFADLALRTPGVSLRKTVALPQVALDLSGAAPVLLPDRPGAVTVVALPDRSGPMPQPTEAELALIGAHLNARRLITTELFVTGPSYRRLTLLRAEIMAAPQADLKTVQSACAAALEQYFSPVAGGEDGSGWPFGGPVYHGNVFGLLLAQPGVQRILDLRIALEGVTQDDSADVIPLPEGALVALPAGLMQIEVRYGR